MIPPLLSLLLLLAGCEVREPAPADDGPSSTASSARVILDRVRVSTDLAVLRSAIRMYRAAHEDQLPPDLQALEILGQLQYPDAYDYDPSSGGVSCSELPGL